MATDDAHDEVLARIRDDIAGRQTLIAAVRAAEDAETPEQLRDAMQRYFDVRAANARTAAIWRRRWRLAGRL